jgi:hypothetical protein
MYVRSDGAAGPLLLLQLPTLLLLHPFIHLMLELLFLPQHTTVSAPPSQHPSASSLHQSVIDMSSIHHAPTPEDYLQPTAALASTYRHAETFLRPPTAPAFNHHPVVDASSSSASLQLPASALHSSVHLLPSPPSPSWYCSTTYRDSLMITDDTLFDNPVLLLRNLSKLSSKKQKLKKYPARYKIVHNFLAINMITYGQISKIYACRFRY